VAEDVFSKYTLELAGRLSLKVTVRFQTALVASIKSDIFRLTRRREAKIRPCL